MKQCLEHVKWRKQNLKGRIKTGKNKSHLVIMISECLWDSLRIHLHTN